MNIPKDLFYKDSHEWVKFNDDGTAYVGISDFAQSELGDIVFVNLPEVGDVFEAGDVMADIESVKAVSDIYCPLSGTVCEINEQLIDSPELINSDAYESWLVMLQDVSERGDLLSSDEYEDLINK